MSSVKKLCSAPGCNTIVEGGGYRCPQHLTPTYTPKRQYDHHYHQGKAIYKSSWWLRLRAAQLAKEPCCQMCAQYGISTPANTVDHIVEISQGGAMDDPDNLQSLCSACHNTKTAKEAVKRRKKKKQNGFKSLSDF